MDMWSSLRGGLISVKTLMGILIVWSLKFCVLDFWICRDLPSNSILSKIKLCSFFLAQHLIYIKNFFYTIVDQPKGFHLENFNNWGQNSYGRRTIWSLISSDFLILKIVKKVLPSSFTDFPIKQRVASGLVIIATRGLDQCQNSYGNTDRLKFEILCPTNEHSIEKFPYRIQV